MGWCGCLVILASFFVGGVVSVVSAIMGHPELFCRNYKLPMSFSLKLDVYSDGDLRALMEACVFACRSYTIVGGPVVSPLHLLSTKAIWLGMSPLGLRPLPRLLQGRFSTRSDEFVV